MIDRNGHVAQPFRAIVNAASPKVPAPSAVIDAHDHKIALQRNNPVLAALYRIEALGDGRIETDMCAIAQLAAVQELAMAAIETLTGQSGNPLYPRNGRPSQTERWRRIAALIEADKIGHSP